MNNFVSKVENLFLPELSRVQIKQIISETHAYFRRNKEREVIFLMRFSLRSSQITMDNEVFSHEIQLVFIPFLP